MDYTDKITRFDSLDDLVKEISIDKASTEMLARRYGVRFIMLDNFDAFKKLAVELSKLNIQTIDIEQLLPPENIDGWITTDELKNEILKCNESSLVTPFSELARFYPESEFRGFFNEIFLTEAFMERNLRVYIPLIGLKNRFTDFLQHFTRIQESGPIWQYNSGEQHVDVFTTIPDHFQFADMDSLTTIENMYDWLVFWKKAAPQKKVICYSRTIRSACKYAIPDNIFSFKRIDNSYQYITLYWEKNIPIKYKKEENSYWDILLKEMSSLNLDKFSFDGFVKNRFNKQHFEPSTILEEWADSKWSAFDRWLLKSYLLDVLDEKQSPYFFKCIKDLNKFDHPEFLFAEIATQIYYYPEAGVQLTYADERRNLIKENALLFAKYTPELTQDWMKNQLEDVYRTSGDLQRCVKLCSGVFLFERIYALQWFGDLQRDVFSEDMLKELYPEMEYYLDKRKPKDITEKQAWCLDYFQAYKNAKIADKYTDEIRDFINDKNADASSFYKWYHSFTNSLERLAEKQGKQIDKPDKIYWIDGLGAEYFAFLINMIEAEHSNFEIVYSTITKAFIPSSTDLNRPDMRTLTQKYEGMDKIGHDPGRYKKYDTLVTEITELKRIIKEIIQNNLSEKTTIAIYSDHGMSFLSRLEDPNHFKKKTEHEGRYVKVDAKSSTNTSDFVIHVNEKDSQSYQVALKHASLGNLPTHEVHGGCTPEEVLVPFVIISNRNEKQPYTFDLKSEEKIALSDGKIKMVIKPDPGYATLELDGREYDMIKTVGNVWTADVKDIEAGEYKYRVYPSGGDPYEGKVEFYGMGFNSADNDFDF